MDTEQVKKFVAKGRSAQKAVDAIINSARKKIAGKTECEYDGTRLVYTDGRCAFCGFTRRQAVLAARKWEKQYPHLCPDISPRRRAP